MTELLLISMVSLLGVAMAVTVARWLVQRPGGDEELMRVAAVVDVGVRRYLARQNVVAAALAAVLGASVFLAFGVAYQTEVVTAVSPREYGLWVTLSYALGACAALLAGWVAAWASRVASTRVATGAWRSLDEPLQIAMRAGAVSGVTALSLALLGLTLLYLGNYLYIGRLGELPEQAMAAAPRIPLLLGGFALGAAAEALLGQLGGGVFGDVADIGAGIGGKLGGPLGDDAADNPAVVADLVGERARGTLPAAAQRRFVLMGRHRPRRCGSHRRHHELRRLRRPGGAACVLEGAAAGLGAGADPDFGSDAVSHRWPGRRFGGGHRF